MPGPEGGERLREAAERLVGYQEGAEVCFCCGEWLTMDSPQQGHAPECSYEHLRAALAALQQEPEVERALQEVLYAAPIDETVEILRSFGHNIVIGEPVPLRQHDADGNVVWEGYEPGEPVPLTPEEAEHARLMIASQGCGCSYCARVKAKLRALASSAGQEADTE